jgi:hypothetical protein
LAVKEALLLAFPYCSSIINEDFYRAGKIYLEHNLGNTMVWGSASGEFISLEPVTGLPARIESGFIGSFGSCYIEPGEIAFYKSRITPTLEI